jgi:hypothetical protein
MNEYQLIIIILLAILIFLFLVPVDGTCKKLERFSDIRSKFKTGDILFFLCNHHSNLFQKIQYYCRTSLINSNAGHVGIIIRDGNNLFVLECVNGTHSAEEYAYHKNNKGKGGIRLINMDILIKEYYRDYKGSYAVRFISQELSNELVFRSAERYREHIFDNPISVAILASVDIVVSHKLAIEMLREWDENRIICTEFAHKVLYECGVMKEFPSKLFWPHLYSSKNFNDYTYIPYSEIVSFDHS